MGEKLEEKKKEEKEKIEVITAIYKVNLHCHQCCREIKKPLARTQGVQLVEVDMEKNEIRVKGSNLDVLKIHKQIEKLSKKRVELISPIVKPKEKDTTKVTDNKPKPILIHRTITAKVHLHCAKCEQDLKNKLLKHKGIYSVKTDMKAQTLTVEGTIEPEKFKSYLKKKLHKNVDITADKKLADSSKPPEKKKESTEKEKPEKKKESTEKEKQEKKKESIEKEKPEKKKESTEKEKPEKKKESIEKEKPKEKTSSETANKITEVQTKDNDNTDNKKNNVPYFIHYVYAPQLFSDENPNACRVM